MAVKTYLITYRYQLDQDSPVYYKHKICEDPLLELLNMINRNNGHYSLINTLEINPENYLTQNLATIKYNLKGG
jgi:hypothetical protein